MKIKRCLVAVAALLMANAAFVELSAQTVFKGFLLRSNEKMDFVSEEWVREGLSESEKKELLESLGEDASEEDKESVQNAQGWKRKEVKKNGYEVIALNVEMDFSADAYSYRDNPYLQEDIVKFISKPGSYSDSLEKVMCAHIKDAKSVDDISKKLKKVKGYQSFVGDDTASYIAEIAKYKESRGRACEFWRFMKVSLENGVLYLKENKGSGYKKTLGVYDAETGKRIEPEDLLTTLKLQNWKDSVTICGVAGIEGTDISFYYEGGDFYNHTLKKDSPMLTPYAKSLMAKDKGYVVTTNVNEYGDQIRSFLIKRVNGGYEDRTVYLPVQLKGCKNTQKIRNRMMKVMFGSADGDEVSLIVEGVKKWVPEYGRGSQMLFNVGDGLVSFGFENLSTYSNVSNTFIVFDKSTGDEIGVGDLIKDKKGFMDYVNSHNMYFAGFLFDSTNVDRGTKVGSEIRGYLKHSGGYLAPFKGLSEFPTSWWFAFSKMDDFIVVEFNTKQSRVFLNYSDIKAFIDPKYHDIMDRAVKSIKK